MDWTTAIDNYCERMGPGFWAEPWNAVSNAAFVVAAVVGLAAARRRDRLDGGIVLLVAILAVIGVGSFLFHTFATRWAVIADVIPIQAFIFAYFALAMRRFAGFPWWAAGLAAVLFAAISVGGASALSRLTGGALNGSEGYVPPLVALGVVGAALWLAGRRCAGASLIAGAAIFAVSLTFRTVDMVVCPTFPLGTHFVWHTLNGVLLGFLVVAMVRFGAVRGRRVAH